MTTPTPSVVRVTFYDLPGMTEPSVELWYQIVSPLCELGAPPTYGYASFNSPAEYRPSGLTDAQWLNQCEDSQVHTFYDGQSHHPGDGRQQEAQAWAVRYGWVES